jgi:hypothetical protein
MSLSMIFVRLILRFFLIFGKRVSATPADIDATEGNP